MGFHLVKWMKTIILRHRRENLKKCSLRGLENRSDLIFYTYPVDLLPDYSSYLLLKVDAPPLTLEDQERGLFLIDGTWRLAQIMEKQLPWKLEARSLPGGFKTAYPRRQTDCPDPTAGLSSIEALYLAHTLLQRSTENLLDRYYWKERFLQINDFSIFRTTQ
jgi:pre-rRNA-processing protein TSR3